MRSQPLLILTFLLFLVCLPEFSNAQRNCSAMDMLEAEIQQDPQRAIRLQEIEEHTEKAIANNAEKIDGIIQIPVVVHVVFNTSAENISDAQIQSQIDILNEDFRRMNADADNVWSQAEDSEIEFCLATVDPNGNPTNGITRTSTSTTSFNNNNVKFTSAGGRDAWPSDEYMNFWVCDLAGGLLGFAQFPGGNPATDGIVCDYQYVGNIGTATFPFHLGRTATHEVGHWLNLRHIWGDGNCNFDDFVADTPRSDASNGGCAIGHVSCGSVDMVQNYMDYSNDACMNLFTAGQNARMRALFDPGGARESLLTSPAACERDEVQPTCTDGIQNGNETGVDCGGPDCVACPTCTDGILNGNETDVDCGGPDCPACPTCVDGIMNGDETGIDCGGSCAECGCGLVLDQEDFENGLGIWIDGGSDCALYTNGNYASSGINTLRLRDNSSSSNATTNNLNLSSIVALKVQFHFYPRSMESNEGFRLQLSSNGGGTYTTIEEWVVGNDFANDQSYFTTIDIATNFTANTRFRLESFGSSNTDWVYFDDIRISICNGEEIMPSCDDGLQNGDETDVDCGGSQCPACPTCFDGIQNGNETDVDCGGSDCPACPTCFDGVQNGNETDVDCGGPDCIPCSTGGPCTTVNLSSDGFETDLGFWNDGGSDCERYFNSSYANSGSYTVRLRDDSFSSTLTSDDLNLSNFEDLSMEFTYLARSMDNSGEGFSIQLSQNGGASWSNLATYRLGTEFNNDVRYFETLPINGPFSSNTRIRFVCEGSSNTDWVYIDDVSIDGCAGAARFGGDEEQAAAMALAIAPNPVKDLVWVTYRLEQFSENVQLTVSGIDGQVVQQLEVSGEPGAQRIQLNLSDKPAGIYLVSIISEHGQMSRKLVLMR